MSTWTTFFHEKLYIFVGSRAAFRSVKSWRFRRLSLIICLRRLSCLVFFLVDIQIFASNRYLSFACSLQFPQYCFVIILSIKSGELSRDTTTLWMPDFRFGGHSIRVIFPGGLKCTLCFNHFLMSHLIKNYAVYASRHLVNLEVVCVWIINWTWVVDGVC